MMCRSEEHTSELQSRVDISYAVFCLKKKAIAQAFSFASPSASLKTRLIFFFALHILRSSSLLIRPVVVTRSRLFTATRYFFLVIRGPRKSPLFPYAPFFQ